MSEDRFSREAPDITGEACAWIAQLETGELTTADRDAFREWMSRSPRHAAEIRRLADMSTELNVLTQMAEPIEEAAARYPSIMRRRHRRSLTTSWRLGALGAAAAGVVAALAFFFLPGNVGTGEQWLLETAVGEQRDVRLADGTLVTLNTDSRLEIDYDGSQRTGRLLKGEAFFDVTSDQGRPFLVYAGEKYVRVIGTAFVVRLLDEDFTVTVVEGQVELAETATAPADGASVPEGAEDPQPAGASGPLRPIFLEAGQSITIPASKRASQVVNKSERDLQRELSWQEGLHDFSETPLEDVIREISRYSPLEVEIADAALRDIRFGGIFRTGETQPLLDALQASYGVEVEYVGERKVRLSLMADDAGRADRGERD